MNKTHLVKLYLNPATSSREQTTEVEYKLRIIGLINDEQLAKIKKDKSLVKKLITSPSISLDTISTNRSLDNHRIVGVIHEKNGKPEIALDKLFVTEKIEDITCMSKRFASNGGFSDPYVKLTIIGKKGTFMIFEDVNK